ncbi:hypothetical protein M0805_006267 [Coniferiporia weirii]|nr:hypothetical protein M0805_006267 [Coniferiporia weirii]
MIYTALLLSALPAFVAAVNTTVQVAFNSTLTFTPNNITASTGDVITFLFDAPNHSVTQSSLADPCIPLPGGFNSGFSTAANTSWELQITNGSAPIWFFCAQTSPAIHCEKGMVGAINAPSDASLSSFSAGALATTVTPSVSPPVQLSGINAVATASIGSFTGSAPGAPSATSPGASGTGTSGSPPASTTTSPAQKLTVGLGGAGSVLLALLGAALF